MNAVPRVLVVEDEEPLADALRTGLAAEGFSVEVASDGVSGLAFATSGEFDVVVLDLMLPGMNGVRVCKRIRESETTIPILVLTAKQGEWDESETLDIGADDFLRKPFSFAVLVSRIRALLRRAAQSGYEVIEVGDLVLKVSQRRCWRNGQEIELTPREFALLERLARSAGQTVPKRQLLDEVWDFALDDSSNIVEVYVGYLRRKVDVPFERDTIRTVRGVGYRLDVHDG
jgi:two-component system OmpR family response regulator